MCRKVVGVYGKEGDGDWMTWEKGFSVRRFCVYRALLAVK